MIELWHNLSSIMQIVWVVTAVATLIFLIQTVLTFIGIDSDINTDMDLDSGMDSDSGTGLLTFRNFVNFFLGFGWTAILMREDIASTGLLFMVSTLAGIVLVIIVMLIFKWLSSMQQSGNIDPRVSAPGCEGTVYLSIPAARSGLGKVQISINCSIREYEAMTDEDDTLPTGTPIKVSEVVGDNILIVEKFNNLIV